MIQEVTFKEFAALMHKRKRSVDDLVDLFRGKIEEPREFLERVMACRHKGEDRSGGVIPYRSVIEFYLKESRYFQDSEDERQALAVKRKRGPVSDEQRQILIERLRKGRASKSAMSVTVEN